LEGELLGRNSYGIKGEELLGRRKRGFNYLGINPNRNWVQI